jgi:hypothetical protein
VSGPTGVSVIKWWAKLLVITEAAVSLGATLVSARAIGILE